MPETKFIAIRQAKTKVVGSRVMTRHEAEREVAVWRDNIGPATKPTSMRLARMSFCK